MLADEGNVVMFKDEWVTTYLCGDAIIFIMLVLHLSFLLLLILIKFICLGFPNNALIFAD